MDGARLKLPDVTICAADSVFVGLTVRALKLSTVACDFGDAILFSHAPAEGPFRFVKIQPLTSIGAYSRFCLQGMADHIRTEFALVIQWDGYVVNPAAWSNAFRKYDYIGAAWINVPETVAVGNGGFSLRSRRLLKTVQKLPWVDDRAEDKVICLVHRAALERQGMRFAPIKIADRFSRELKAVEKPTFGFHGPHDLWRYNDDAELVAMIAGMDVARIDPSAVLLLALGCTDNDRPVSARLLYRKFRQTRTAGIIRSVLTEWHGAAIAEGELARLEALR